MTNKTCPQCGEINEESAVHCAGCGARLDEPAKPKPVPFGELLHENWRNLLWLGGGVVFLAMGIYAPWLGTAIIQLLLFFTESGRPTRSSNSSSDSACDRAIVIFFAVACFTVGGVGLYRSLRTFWGKRLGSEEEETILNHEE